MLHRVSVGHSLGHFAVGTRATGLLGFTPFNGRGLTPFNPNLVPLLMFAFDGGLSVLLFTISFVAVENAFQEMSCGCLSNRGKFKVLCKVLENSFAFNSSNKLNKNFKMYARMAGIQCYL